MTAIFRVFLGLLVLNLCADGITVAQDWVEDESWQDVPGSFDTDDAFDSAIAADEEKAAVQERAASVSQPNPGWTDVPFADERGDLPAYPWEPQAPPVDELRIQDAPEGSRTFLTNLVLENLPGDYEDDKHWGKTRKRWDGVKMRMDGLKLRTNRRWKEVNHGTWKRYHIELIDPNEHLLVKITDWQQRGIGTVGFQLNLAARVRVIGRRQEWNNGVRLYSVTAEAIADVRLNVGMQVSTKLDATKFPPDVILLPVAETADARLVQFKLQRISHADGPVVRELGDGLEKILRKILAEKNAKLVGKVNRQFEKKKDDLRLSVSDLVKHKWLGIEPPDAGK